MGVRLFVMTKPREPLPSRYLLLRRCDQDHHCSEASRQAQPAARRQQGPRPLRQLRAFGRRGITAHMLIDTAFDFRSDATTSDRIRALRPLGHPRHQINRVGDRTWRRQTGKAANSAHGLVNVAGTQAITSPRAR